MKKIQTIFDRDWEGNRGVIDKYVVNPNFLKDSTPTEKIDGTNVRLTVRNHTLVRLEKRRNPSKSQKQKGIEEPWYVDADENDPTDKHIWAAACHTGLSDVPDGEWSGEAVGPGIQGNYYQLNKPFVCLFSLGRAPVLSGVPVDYDGLREYLSMEHSIVNPGVLIEGVVWHHDSGEMFKIKGKDFK